MSAAKRDFSGAFNLVHVTVDGRPTWSVFDVLHFSTKGITFRSSRRLAPFTEVGVDVHLTHSHATAHPLHCQGVVVDCQGNKFERDYTVTVAFLNLPTAKPDELPGTLHAAPRKADRRLTSRARRSVTA